MNLIFLDCETTDLDAKRLVQLAYRSLNNWSEEEKCNALFKPPIPISAGASSVSHIANEDVADKPTFSGSPEAKRLQELLQDHILVAHNAEFDIQVLANEGINTKWYICTQKIAQRMLDDPSIEKFSLQYLRYYLKLHLLEKDRYQAHDAWGDICILENLFRYLLDHWNSSDDIKQRIVDMINISGKPVLLRRVTFGKHKGKTWEELAYADPAYLVWIRDKKENNSPDELFTVNYYIDKIMKASQARVV